MSEGKRVFEYQPRSDETILERTKDVDKRRDGYLKSGFTIFTPKAGSNRVRFLPPTWDKAKHYGLDVYVHFGIGPDNSSFLCLKKMKGEKCPVCEELERPEVSGNKELVSKLKWKRRVLVAVIDRTDEENSPKVWSCPPGIDTNFVLQSVDEDTGKVLTIDDPNAGYDVFFEREGEKLQTQYKGEKIARKASAISIDPKVYDRYINFIVENPLPSLLVYKEYKYIKGIFEGVGASTEKEPEEVMDKDALKAQFKEKWGGPKD